MAQQAAQFLHGSLCLVGIEGDEGVDVVQRIEQEVRVELVAQVLQLGFRAAFLGFAAGGVHLRPAAAQLDGSAEAGCENHGRDVAQDEYPFGRQMCIRDRRYHECTAFYSAINLRSSNNGIIKYK